MKNNGKILSGLIIMLAGAIYLPAQAQQKHDVKTKDVTTSHGPNSIVRNVIQDRKGDIWIASWQGIFRYDGKSFTNVTSKVSSARFFSVLEDRKGNLWFGSIGSGVYYYDEKSFRNFTTRDGLPNNDVTCIYEDKAGAIWFGTKAGPSRYDGKSFVNFKIKDAPSPGNGDSIHVSVYKHGLPEVHWMHNDVNAIIEDRTGKFWFGTRGYACVYDGKAFTTLTNNDGKPFANVRSIIEDKKGNIWLGGNEGLWRYDGKTFTNFTRDFVGYIYEDKEGNIWTSSEHRYSMNDNLTSPLTFGADSRNAWILSRYDEKSLSDEKPSVTEIKPTAGMLTGIVEANDGSIWFGGSDGVYRYNGKTVMGFNGKEGQK